MDKNNIIKVSGKNQIVIPKEVRKKFNIKSGDYLITKFDDEKIILYPSPKSFTKYAQGLGKEIWKDTDAKDYVKKERQSWKD
ncbi:MAG: AbrB/MazE/SpoVT family DNA-binding domain-containing protein [Atribacterota bacterium]|jgi:AbrB family looped-hinge helix DNA binding protein|nr:AbrB/MazE/SpoVT family DNA-binding domain-containing protein [Atribacterota bacterium]MDI9596236.1 AbrB/MazE/SpoVT family DNA-binding domain-containing protein [Atribacterota bacterium]